ncbi:MAG: Gfo/Idh/MocA family protein [Planctomycetota bacterium]
MAAAKKSTLGFGIVGLGMIAEFHAKAIEAMTGGKLVACFSRSAEKAKTFAAAHACTAYSDLKKFLADPNLDVVCICTPSGAHRDPAVAAAHAGKHVVVEKPLEITLERCDAILAACAKNKVKLATIFPSRFSDVNQTIKQAVDAGRLGKKTVCSGYTKWHRTQQYYDSGAWRGTWDLDGGGALMNQSIHNIDLLLWFMGDVVEVQAFAKCMIHKRIEVEDAAVATLKFKNGAIGVFEGSTACWPGFPNQIELCGSDGTIVSSGSDLIEWKFAAPATNDAKIAKQFETKSGASGGASDPKAISFVGHQRQLEDFARVVLGKQKKPLCDGKEGRRAVELILAIYQSALTGKKVTLPLKKTPVRKPFAK